MSSNKRAIGSFGLGSALILRALTLLFSPPPPRSEGRGAEGVEVLLFTFMQDHNLPFLTKCSDPQSILLGDIDTCIGPVRLNIWAIS